MLQKERDISSIERDLNLEGLLSNVHKQKINMKEPFDGYAYMN